MKYFTLVRIKPLFLLGLNGSPVPSCLVPQGSWSRNAVDLIPPWSRNKSSKNGVCSTNVLYNKNLFDSTERVCNILTEQKEAHLCTHWCFVHCWEKKSERAKTPDFRSHHQAFSPSTTDRTQFAKLEVEHTLPGSTRPPVSNPKFAGRNTSKDWKQCYPTRLQEEQLSSTNPPSRKIGEGNVLKDLIWKDIHSDTIELSLQNRVWVNTLQVFLGLVSWCDTTPACAPFRIMRTLPLNTHKGLMDYWEFWLRIQHVVLRGFIM